VVNFSGNWHHILKRWFGVRHTLYFDFVGRTLFLCIFVSNTPQHIKRLFYPSKLGPPVSSLPLLMSGPALRPKTRLCGDASAPTRTPALAFRLSLSSPNLSPVNHTIRARRWLTARQLWSAHSPHRPRWSGHRRASCFPTRAMPLAFGCRLCHPRRAAVPISFLAAGSWQNSTPCRRQSHRSCMICGSSG
jgi:hypothetical protein